MYKVVHATAYDYSDTIAIARQLAHLKPRSAPWQNVLSHHLDIDPAPSERTEGIDYFGNAVVRFAIEKPHDALTVRAESVVAIDDHAPACADDLGQWENALSARGDWGPGIDLMFF